MADIPETDEAARICTVLQDNPLGLSIKEISAAVAMSRNSVAKYLEVLTATGRLEVRHVGNAKLYTLSRRVPVGNILKLAKELIIVLDSRLQVVQASDSLCSFSGTGRERVMHARLSSLPVPLLTPEEEKDLEILLTGGNSWKKEIRILRNGLEVFLDGRFIPTVLESGEPGITIILEDTTERRLAEKMMRERDRLLYTIFQIPTVPRFFIDHNHKVVYWDRALEIMTGIKSEEVTGTNRHWRAFYPEERPCLVDLLIDGNTEKIVRNYRGKSLTTPDSSGGYECTEFFPALGQEGRWLHITATVIRDSAGHLTGAMETVEDVTDRKKSEFVVEG